MIPNIPVESNHQLTKARSFIIDRLSEDAVSKKAAVVYYFFEYNLKQSLAEFFGVFLKQLCLLLPKLPVAVLELFSRADEDKQIPSVGVFAKAIRAVSSEFTRTYMIVDALDEHDSWNGKEMTQLLLTLKSLECNLLITSRDDLYGANNISSIFAPDLLQLVVEPDTRAIRYFIEKRIDESKDLKFVGHDAKSTIVQNLSRATDNHRAMTGLSEAHRCVTLLVQF